MARHQHRPSRSTLVITFGISPIRLMSAPCYRPTRRSFNAPIKFHFHPFFTRSNYSRRIVIVRWIFFRHPAWQSVPSKIYHGTDGLSTDNFSFFASSRQFAPWSIHPWFHRVVEINVFESIYSYIRWIIIVKIFNETFPSRNASWISPRARFFKSGIVEKLGERSTGSILKRTRKLCNRGK